MSSLKIPYAKAGGRTYLPKEAMRRHQYMCPECRGSVRLVKPNWYRWHFRHDAERHECRVGETIQHLEGKAYLLELLRDGMKKESHTVYMKLPCEKCRHPRLEPLNIFRQGYTVETEYPFRTKSGDLLRADVALIKNNKPNLVLEVYHSHRVDKDKASKMDSLGLGWVEILAEHRGRYIRPFDWGKNVFVPNDNDRCLKCKLSPTDKIKMELWEGQVLREMVG